MAADTAITLAGTPHDVRESRVTEQERTTSLRLARVEAQLAIGQLPIRYALAVDQRDLDAWVSLFVPDVDMGRHGRGRAVLRDWIAPSVATFYRSVHQICGHRIVLGPEGPSGESETATGHVYCRAEHEVGERWIVMAIRYDDTYHRVDGEWFFARRQERHWYAADVNEHPSQVDFDGWHSPKVPPTLPGPESSWAEFWRDRDLGSLTSRP
jgi:hypothetical protein